jgi:hypothetical protein
VSRERLVETNDLQSAFTRPRYNRCDGRPNRFVQLQLSLSNCLDGGLGIFGSDGNPTSRAITREAIGSIL